MAEISADTLTRFLVKAVRTFTSGELAYLALTSKPEHPIRDRLAWILHNELPGCVIAREWMSPCPRERTSPGAKRNRARADLAILRENDHRALAIVEMKAAYTFDFDGAGRQTVEKYGQKVKDDLVKAREAGGTEAQAFALLLLTHPTSAPVQPTPVVKYASEISRSLNKRGAAALAVTAREVAENRLKTLGDVTSGTLSTGSAFGIEVFIDYFLVAEHPHPA
ncbi:hypothetical protein [Streptomyces sp. ST2-7A]|uniref:hypothetical protein n=1 Tax=Streptomyces sp. ST2-7A TaxID=2907214 RepID=UPI001F283F09|nr:hypothetical protein [Streptomyces sp. ST2-7A]MCE7082860.1 hypothetical protein [Streptomyces sp. ST2-7A]